MSDELSVFLHGAQVATLNRTRSGRMTMQYLDSGSGCVSLSMTPQTKPYSGDTVRNWIDNLIPDDERLRSAWARDNNAASSAPFDLLATSIGEDCAGAVQFVRPSESDRLLERGGTTSAVADEWVGQRLAQLRHNADLWQGIDHSRLMYSIGGLQPKLGLHKLSDGRWAHPRGDTPTTHILKPAPRTDWPHLDINEHICLAAAKSLGVLAATTAYQYIGNEPALVVERFDRSHSRHGWRRIHAEDLCQAAGLRPDQKTENSGGLSISAIARLLRAHAADRKAGEESVQRFGQALALNWVILGSDAHAKNYTMLHLANGSAVLAPLYDVSSNLGHLRFAADPAEYEALALAMSAGTDYTVGGTTTRQAWRAVAEALRIDEQFLVDEAQRIAAGFGDAAEHQMDQLAERIDLRQEDELFCHQMLARIRQWERHVSSMPVIGGNQPGMKPAPNVIAERVTAGQQSSRTAIRCNQPLPAGELCNRRLRNTACPLHPTSPGSRQIRAR